MADQDIRAIRKWGLRGSVAVVGLMVLNGTWFTIDQTDMGNVRRFGTALYDREHPLGPGLHFKLPIVDSVDQIQVSLQTVHIPEFRVSTIDNQVVTIEENFNYTVAPDQVYHVLYEVGRSGDVDIHNQVLPVALDRTARVLSSKNMVTVNADRETVIQPAIEKEVSAAVQKLFGITPHSLQIPKLVPSDAFLKSIDEATLAKNAAIAAENQLRTKQFEAQQVAATAKGAADAAIENARGSAESIRLNAEATKTKLTLEAEGNKARLVLEGEGLQANYESQIKPFGSVDKYTAYIVAKAALNWNGQTPQIVSGNAGNGPNLIVPVPSYTR